MVKPRRERTTVGLLLPAIGNLAGVLVIVALVLAAHARSMPAPLEPPPEDSTAELDAQLAAIGDLETEIERDREQSRGLAELGGKELADRAELEAAVKAAETALATRRAALDEDTRKQFDLAHALTQARAELARLDALEMNLKAPPKKVVQVQNFPTPIGKQVDGHELHFQLKHNRVSYVPLEELIEKFRAVAQNRLWRLEGQDEMVDTIGPLDGFNLRYTVERQEMDWETAKASGRRGGGSLIVVTHFDLLPVSQDQGETLQQALSNTSQFRGRLDGRRPEDWTVTLWVYPESFEEFRAIRAELYHLGFAIAGRPLPEGIPIGASPGGSKSSAE